MKKIILFGLCAVFASTAGAQTTNDGLDADTQKQLKKTKDTKLTFGLKAGYNVAKITGQSANFSPDTKNGFTVAAFYSPGPKTGIGYRTELVFSRQGFEFAEGGKNAAVTNDYIYMPHFTTFGIGKIFQLQVGGQMGYLLKSSKQSPSEKTDITSFASRLDYGAAAGVEIYPGKHFIVGGRYNISFGNAYEQMNTAASTPSPFPMPFNPNEVKGKNAVINFFLGFRF